MTSKLRATALFTLPLWIIASAPFALTDMHRRASNTITQYAFARVHQVNAQATQSELQMVEASLPEHLLQPLPVKP